MPLRGEMVKKFGATPSRRIEARSSEIIMA